MNLEYKQKYLKYKNKYLNLKLELEGGKKIVRQDLVYIYHRFKNDKIGTTSTYKPFEYQTCEDDNCEIRRTVFLPKGMKSVTYLNNNIDDSGVKLIHERNNILPRTTKDFLEDFVNANFEYLEMKYGGRFEKNGIFKKGKHSDTKGKYIKHKSSMIGHYHGYFDGLLKPWEEGTKQTPTPILLKDNQTIYDNIDFYRDTFLLAVTPFNGRYYHKARKPEASTQEEARMIMINQIIKRLQIGFEPKNTGEWLEFLKSQKTSKGTYQPNIKYITDAAKAAESFKQETKDIEQNYEYDLKDYIQYKNKGYEAYSEAFHL